MFSQGVRRPRRSVRRLPQRQARGNADISLRPRAPGEMLRDHPLLLNPPRAAPPAVHYRLVPWHAPEDGAASRGTLADLSSDTRIAAGLYKLELEVPTGSAAPLRESHWLLFAPW